MEKFYETININGLGYDYVMTNSIEVLKMKKEHIKFYRFKKI